MLNLGILAGLLIAALVFVSGCVPQSTQGDTGSSWLPIVFLVVIFALFYFVLIRPQRRKQKEQQEMVQQLHKGDRVITAGGIYGVIESTRDDSVVLKVESGATIRVARASVIGRSESKSERTPTIG